ncbi:MAG TPA: hypothetical protein VGN33_04595 [Leifsonia sp.]|jgi:hypothetical protein|nr:hypothetical protein [Leifsonia sp.]
MGNAKRLPSHLSEAPFSTRRARAEGVAARRLRARDVAHPFHGVNATMVPASLIERCEAYVERMLDGQVFSHATAAALYGMPLSADTTPGPLHVSVARPRTPPRARGVVGHSLADPDIREVAGMPACSPAQVWLQLAATLEREELVAVGDHILGSRNRPALASLRDLRDAVRTRNAPGVRALRWAVERVRCGADSRPESLLRLAVVEAGLPEPSINPPIMLPEGLVIHPDLVFFPQRTILEYEGDGHRTDSGQWMRDIRRHDLTADAGWRVMRVTRVDLFAARPEFVGRLRRTLHARRVTAPP